MRSSRVEASILPALLAKDIAFVDVMLTRSPWPKLSSDGPARTKEVAARPESQAQRHALELRLLGI